ncbi:hypothetical protein [Neobacillus sp. FSL H8-0543]|uniref:hypothetical protein n=1 Tax=Neobacillus sp. FSL H8-0543 TaxID=2954672 RepID=UPI00315991DB
MINSKDEVREFLKNFESFAQWNGEKYYLFIETNKPKGTLTIIKSQDGGFYYHRKNELYWDLKEIKVENGILTDIIWTFRNAINKSLEKIVL